MYWLGIDPGLTGAFCLLDADTKEVEFHDTPVFEIKVGKSLKKEMNASQIVLMLQSLSANREVQVVIEKVQAMPGSDGHGGRQSMGATSAFNFGKGFGMWLGILAALQLPFSQVHPATWKSAMMRGADKDKDASRVRALEMFPKAAGFLARKKDHGRADALLLAAFGAKEHSNPMRATRTVDQAPINGTLFG